MIQVKDWRKIPLSNLKFILEQAEKKLEETIENSHKITDRFYSILLVLVTIFTAGIGYFLTDYTKSPGVEMEYLVDMVFLSILLVLILLFIKNISPRKFMGKGRIPHELSNKALLEPSSTITEDEQYKALLIGEINNLESKIVFNQSQNEKRLKRLKELILSIVLATTIYFIIFQLLGQYVV